MLRKLDRIGWIIAMVCAIIVVSTFIHTSSQDFASGYEKQQRGGRDVIQCDRKKFTHYIGVGASQVQARQELFVKACWRKASAKRNPGLVLDKRGYIRVKYYNTGWGDFHGANWIVQQTWRPGWGEWDNRFRVTKMKHVGYKQCASVGGQRVCGPTADFSVGAVFNSPYLVRHSDGSLPIWKFVWMKGEPRKDPGSYDDNVWICPNMCT